MYLSTRKGNRQSTKGSLSAETQRFSFSSLSSVGPAVSAFYWQRTAQTKGLSSSDSVLLRAKAILRRGFFSSREWPSPCFEISVADSHNLDPIGCTGHGLQSFKEIVRILLWKGTTR
jgi:hypothetical protein